MELVKLKFDHIWRKYSTFKEHSGFKKLDYLDLKKMSLWKIYIYHEIGAW